MEEIYSKWGWNERYGTHKTHEVIRVLTILFCRIETLCQTPFKPIDQVDEKHFKMVISGLFFFPKAEETEQQYDFSQHCNMLENSNRSNFI